MNRKYLMLGGAGLIVLALVGAGFYYLKPVHPDYQVAEASVQDLVETVRTHGTISSAQNVDLSFDRGGRIVKVFVQVGQKVSAGQQLITLENSAEAAQLSGAEAALKQRAAGATPEQIAISQAAVDAAKAALQENPDGSSLIITQAKQNEVIALGQISPVLDGALSQADEIVSVDNPFANESIRDSLSIKDKSHLYAAVAQYGTAKKSIADFRTSLAALADNSTAAEVSASANSALKALTDTATLLTDVSDALNASLAQGGLAQPTLDNKKAAILSTRSAVTAQYAAVQSKIQAIDGAASTLAQRQAAYNQAVATLKSSSDPVRAVDLAPLEAAVSAARANFSKTILRSPVSGTVSRNDAKLGGVASANVPLVSVINTDKFQIETYVAENDIGKIKVGDSADVTVDAFGSSTIFPATVSSVDQSAVTNNGTNSYKVILAFTKPDSRLKADMNANIIIKIGEDKKTLAVPERSVIQRDDKYYVMLQGGSTLQEKEVTIGAKGNGYWEILSGLSSGDKVINFGQ